MMISKRDWILLALRKTPLDRIRLMKTLFLVWNRSGRSIAGYFEFEPYLYGPCSLEMYSVLDDLTEHGFPSDLLRMQFDSCLKIHACSYHIAAHMLIHGQRLTRNG